MTPAALTEYKGYKVDHDELNKELCIISFTDYDEAYGIMISLVREGYMIQDLECIDEENKYVLLFNKQ